MNNPIIKVSDIGKKYRIPTNNNFNEDTITGLISTSIKRMITKEDKVVKNKFEEFWALRNIGFQVEEGDHIGIIGHNGAGKSTLLKIFSRIVKPTEGRIEIQGRVASLLEVGTGFHPDLTGRENIYLNGAILGMTRSEINRKFNDIVEFSEIEQFIDTPVKRYSSGMYVRLAFAVAAHLDPDILILDEVLAVGDMKFQEKCFGKINEVSGAGRTILYVSHNMDTIRQLCSRVIVMSHGQMIFDGPVDDAIKIYMENSRDMQTYVNLEDSIRTSNHNQNITMLDIKLLHKENCEFTNEEVIRYKLRWRANKDVENVCIRLEIIYVDTTPAGMTASKAFGCASKGSIKENIFTFAVNNLAPGKYYANIALYNVNKFGTFENLDKVQQAFSFEVINNKNSDNNIIWLHRWWGHVRLPEINISN